MTNLDRACVVKKKKNRKCDRAVVAGCRLPQRENLSVCFCRSLSRAQFDSVFSRRERSGQDRYRTGLDVGQNAEKKRKNKESHRSLRATERCTPYVMLGRERARDSIRDKNGQITTIAARRFGPSLFNATRPRGGRCFAIARSQSDFFFNNRQHRFADSAFGAACGAFTHSASVNLLE